MAMYELDGNHLLPVRLGRSADAETRARSLAAVQRQVIEVLHRPLFPLEWGRVPGGESLTALDATGQVVLVEVLESLSAAEVMAAMARLTATAALGRRELAGRYTGGLVSFREDWNEFREAMPAQVEAGPRLTLITASLAPEVRSSLSVLVGSGVELYEVDVRVVDEARVVVVVEQIVDGSLGAEGPLLVARAPRASLTGPGARAEEPAPGPRIDPVTGPIEIVMPRRSQDDGGADAAAPGHGGRGAAGRAADSRQDSGRAAGSRVAGGRAASGRAEPEGTGSAAPGGRAGRAADDRAADGAQEPPGASAEEALEAGAEGRASRQSRPEDAGARHAEATGRSEAAGPWHAEGARRGSAAGRRAHAAISARRGAVVRGGVHASESTDAVQAVRGSQAAEPAAPERTTGPSQSTGPEGAAGQRRAGGPEARTAGAADAPGAPPERGTHDSATAPSASSGAGAATAPAATRAAQGARGDSGTSGAPRQARSAGGSQAPAPVRGQSRAGAEGAAPAAAPASTRAGARGGSQDGTRGGARAGSRSGRGTRAAMREGAAAPDTPAQEASGASGSPWAAGAGRQDAGASPLPRIAAREAADLAAIAEGFERSQRIIWQGLRRGIYHEAVLSSAGIITLADGRTFTDPTSAANAAQSVADADGWRVWRLGLRGPQLGELRDRLPRSGA